MQEVDRTDGWCTDRRRGGGRKCVRAAALVCAAFAWPWTTATAGQQAYVVGTGGIASVIDTASNTVSAQIQVGGGGGLGYTAAAVTPDGKTAYLVGANIVALDTATKTIRKSVSLGGVSGFGIAITPDGSTAYVTTGNNNVAVYDIATDTITQTITDSSFFFPTGVAVSLDGKTVYVANQAGQQQATVTVIDTASNTVSGTIGPTSGPCGITITPDGTRAYFTVQGGSAVRIIETATNTLLSTNIGVSRNPCSIAATPGGGQVYVATGSTNTVAAIDTTTNTVKATIPVPSAAAVAVRADSQYAYAGDFNDRNVQVIDTATNTIVGLPIALNTGPQAIALVPAQAPVASFSASVSKKSNVANFDASASTDPDGTIAVYAWDYGDGTTAPNGGPTPSHAYTQAGTYTVTLTLTDELGCSTAFVYTGQTVSCNGSDVAKTTRQVTVSSGAAGPGTDQAVQELADLFAAVAGVGPGNSLAAKVTRAQSALKSGNPGGSCSMLRAFVSEVGAQAGKGIPTLQAGGLIASADRIVRLLGC